MAVIIPQERRFAVSELASMPWKNGTGKTRELAIDPANSGLEDMTLLEVRTSSKLGNYDARVCRRNGGQQSLCCRQPAQQHRESHV